MSESQKIQGAVLPMRREEMQEEEEIDLLELAWVLLAKWPIILGVTVAGALAAGLCAFFLITPKYEATATIYVVNNKDSAINLSDLQIGSELTNDYIEVFQMWEVHEQVISNLDLPYSYREMNSMLSVSNTRDTRMINITFTSKDAKEAAKVANEYAEVAREYIAEKMVTDKPTIMSTALVPSSPSSPNKTKLILIGAAGSFVVVCGIIVVITLLNDTYKTAEDIHKYTGLVTLASIPKEQGEHTKTYRYGYYGHHEHGEPTGGNKK